MRDEFACFAPSMRDFFGNYIPLDSKGIEEKGANRIDSPLCFKIQSVLSEDGLNFDCVLSN